MSDLILQTSAVAKPSRAISTQPLIPSNDIAKAYSKINCGRRSRLLTFTSML